MTSSSTTSSQTGALSGVFVLDLTRVLAGPWATQVLGDLGAEIVKIERPGAGDDTRSWGPPFTVQSDGTPGDAAYFLCANRNKQSVTIDMADPQGAEMLRELARQADVVVENFKTGGLAKYGLDYESLKAINPRLVYCSITGFGQTGPYANRAGYDYMIQAMGGLMSVTGHPPGTPGDEPMKVGVAVVDLFTGLYAANAIQAALLHARATGQGQHIDIALFDVQAAMLANQATNYFVSGTPPNRLGNAHPNLTPYQVFATADGAIVVAVGNDGQFRALCKAIDLDELAADLRFTTNSLRVVARADLTPILALALARRTTAEWMRVLEGVSVPCGPINTVDQVFAEPQAQARNLVVEQSRADLTDPIRTVASPIRLSETPTRYSKPPPALGADTESVLRERLGLKCSDVERLRALNVI